MFITSVVFTDPSLTLYYTATLSAVTNSTSTNRFTVTTPDESAAFAIGAGISATIIMLLMVVIILFVLVAFVIKVLKKRAILDAHTHKRACSASMGRFFSTTSHLTYLNRVKGYFTLCAYRTK